MYSPWDPKPKWVHFKYLRPQSKHYLCTWSPRVCGAASEFRTMRRHVHGVPVVGGICMPGLRPFHTQTKCIGAVGVVQRCRSLTISISGLMKAPCVAVFPGILPDPGAFGLMPYSKSMNSGYGLLTCNPHMLNIYQGPML